MSSSWFVPALGFMLAVGASGITLKLSLRDVGWQVLIIASTGFYAILSLALIARGGIRLPSAPGSWALFVVASGALTAGSFPLLVLALERGDASRVIPVTAAYPIVTALLALIFLAEPFNLLRLLGTLLIVAGVALVATQVTSG
jgi:transporter family protein